MLLATGIVDPALGLSVLCVMLFCLVLPCFNKNSTVPVKRIGNGIVNLTFRFDLQLQGHGIKILKEIARNKQNFKLKRSLLFLVLS